MADFNLSDFMGRLLEMEKESVADVAGIAVDGVTYFPYEQEAFPYFTNRTTNMTPIYEPDDMVVFPFRVTGSLVLGHLTEGYKGEPLIKAQDYITAVLSYFIDRPGMKSSAHPTAMQYLAPNFEIVDMVGPNAFQNSGVGVLQVGVNFVFAMPIMVKRHR